MAASASHNARPGATDPAGGEAQLIGGRYRLPTPIGRGAMGVVWSARDELLDREVAVKEVRLPPSLSETERDNGYSSHPARGHTAGRLSHPGVAAVYDIVEERGLRGLSWNSSGAVLLTRWSRPTGRCRRARRGGGQAAARCAGGSTRGGSLHRDVKPSNVLLCPGGRTVLTDFGIATAEGDPSFTQAGVVMGSPGFLPPERIRNGGATRPRPVVSRCQAVRRSGGAPALRSHGGVLMMMARWPPRTRRRLRQPVHSPGRIPRRLSRHLGVRGIHSSPITHPLVIGRGVIEDHQALRTV